MPGSIKMSVNEAHTSPLSQITGLVYYLLALGALRLREHVATYALRFMCSERVQGKLR